MRDPERIDRILALIRHEWLKSPDQRFGQLLSNITGREYFDEAWYYEDSHIEAAILVNLFGDEAGAKALVNAEQAKADASWSKFMKQLPSLTDEILRRHRNRK